MIAVRVPAEVHPPHRGFFQHGEPGPLDYCPAPSARVAVIAGQWYYQRRYRIVGPQETVMRDAPVPDGCARCGWSVHLWLHYPELAWFFGRGPDEFHDYQPPSDAVRRARVKARMVGEYPVRWLRRGVAVLASPARTPELPQGLQHHGG